MHTVSMNQDYKKIVVFDWDNTLFPTNQIFRNHSQMESTTTLKQLQNIGKMIHSTLVKYIDLYGEQNTFIVTNGSEGWVYFSLDYLHKICQTSTYFQSIYNLLVRSRIKIYSAKQLYSSQYPNQSMKWKSLVFQTIVTDTFICNQLQGNPTTKYSILSIGDSTDEYNASFEAKTMLNEKYKINLKDIILHRIKLKHAPTINELKNEVKLMFSLANILCEEVSVSQTINYEREFLKYNK